MRIRDIVHVSGRGLRISLARSGGDVMLISLSDPHCRTEPVHLDPYGGELLAGFLMSARLAAGGDLGEEQCGGLFGCRFRLLSDAEIELSQEGGRILLPQVLWDRLYAELMLSLAHSRHIVGNDRLQPGSALPVPARMLH